LTLLTAVQALLVLQQGCCIVTPRMVVQLCSSIQQHLEQLVAAWSL
jgi:hypothetical protein